MPDREKVIEGLECLLKYYRNVNDSSKCPYRDNVPKEMYCTDCTEQIAQDALVLLKEQEAKPIVRKQCKKEHDDGSIEYFAEWYCPHCDMLILRGFDNPSIKFCYKCGKPILWENR